MGLGYLALGYGAINDCRGLWWPCMAFGAYVINESFVVLNL